MGKSWLMGIREFEEQKEINQNLPELVKAENLSALREAFPDAESLCNAFHPDSVKRASLLAVIVEKGRPAFLKKLLETYFPGDTVQNLKLKQTFLDGRNHLGAKMDYHYFHDMLPAKMTGKIDVVYGIENRNKTDEKKDSRMQEFYQIIKDEKIRVCQKLAPENAENSEKARPAVSSVQQSAVKMPTKEKDTSGVLAFPPLVFRNINYFNGGDYATKVVLWENDGHTPLAERVYRQLEFPEEFCKMVPSLQSFEKEYSAIKNDDYLRPALNVFVNDGGVIRFEDGEDKKVKVNAYDDSYAAYAGKDSHGQSLIVINTACRDNRSKFTHEMVHRADMAMQTEEIGTDGVWASARNLSSVRLMDYVKSLMVVNYIGLSRYKILDEVMHTYPPAQHNCEILARIGEYATINGDRKNGSGYRRDHLMQSMYKLLGRYSEAKVNKNWAVLSRINTIFSRLPYQEKLEELSDAVQIYLRQDALGKKNAVSMFEVLKAKKKVDWLVNSSEWRQGTSHLKDRIEKELVASIFSELRKIHRINRCPEARCLRLPQKVLAAETKTVPEILWARGIEHCKATDARQHSRQMALILDEMEQLAHSSENDLSRQKMLEKFVHLLGYGSRIYGQDDSFCNNENNFGTKRQIMQRAKEYVSRVRLHQKYNISADEFKIAENIGLSAAENANAAYTRLEAYPAWENKVAFLQEQKEPNSVQEKVCSIACVRSLYNEMFPGRPEAFLYFIPENLETCYQQARVFADNLSLYKQGSKDGLTKEGLDALGTSFDMVRCEKQGKIMANHKDWSVFAALFSENGKDFAESKSLLAFCTLRAMQKRYFPHQEMPVSLRLDSLNEKTCDSKYLQEVVAGHIKRFRYAGLLKDCGNLKQASEKNRETARFLQMQKTNFHE